MRWSAGGNRPGQQNLPVSSSGQWIAPGRATVTPPRRRLPAGRLSPPPVLPNTAAGGVLLHEPDRGHGLEAATERPSWWRPRPGAQRLTPEAPAKASVAPPDTARSPRSSVHSPPPPPPSADEPAWRRAAVAVDATQRVLAGSASPDRGTRLASAEPRQLRRVSPCRQDVPCRRPAAPPPPPARASVQPLRSPSSSPAVRPYSSSAPDPPQQPSQRASQSLSPLTPQLSQQLSLQPLRKAGSRETLPPPAADPLRAPQGSPAPPQNDARGSTPSDALSSHLDAAASARGSRAVEESLDRLLHAVAAKIDASARSVAASSLPQPSPPADAVTVADTLAATARAAAAEDEVRRLRHDLAEAREALARSALQQHAASVSSRRRGSCSSGTGPGGASDATPTPSSRSRGTAAPGDPRASRRFSNSRTSAATRSVGHRTLCEQNQASLAVTWPQQPRDEPPSPPPVPPRSLSEAESGMWPPQTVSHAASTTMLGADECPPSFDHGASVQSSRRQSRRHSTAVRSATDTARPRRDSCVSSSHSGASEATPPSLGRRGTADSAGGVLRCEVKDLGGDEMSVALPASAAVAELKAAIRAGWGHAPEQQKLVVRGRVLHNDESLSALRSEPDSALPTLHLILSPPLDKLLEESRSFAAH